jgi:hypothetical protein
MELTVFASAKQAENQISLISRSASWAGEVLEKRHNFAEVGLSNGAMIQMKFVQKSTDGSRF